MDNGFTLYIKKSGWYKIDYCGVNNSATNQASRFYISNTLTNGYTLLCASSFTNVVNTVSVLNQIFYFDSPKYLMINTNGNQTYSQQFCIEWLPTDSTVINQTTNNYINPPLNIVRWFHMWKIQLQTSSTNNVLFTNGTTPVFYMRVPVAGMD